MVEWLLAPRGDSVTVALVLHRGSLLKPLIALGSGIVAVSQVKQSGFQGVKHRSWWPAVCNGLA